MIKNFITSSSIILILLMTSCAKDKENSGIAKKNVPINASERAGQAVEKGGGLQDAIFGKKVELPHLILQRLIHCGELQFNYYRTYLWPM